MRGTLYVVATPIGNLSDMSYRAVETLKTVDVILAENTSETSKLLNRYEIKAKRLLAYRDETAAKLIPNLILDLEAGQSIALTSDSGTPLISDPGYKIVRECLLKDIQVVTVPGPSAVVAALSISGLPTDKFSFIGFLPKKGGQRKELLETFGKLDATLVIYESPFRVLKTLTDIHSILGNRYISVVKELTKLHETTFYGKVEELLETLPTKNLKGEFVILVGKEGLSL